MRARRSCLSVPARPTRKLEKASELVADEIVVDLEDSVPAEQKEEARDAVAEALAQGTMGRRNGQRPGQRRRRRPGSRTTLRAVAAAGRRLDSVDRPEGRDARRPAAGRRAALRGGAGGGPRPADRPPGPDRVRARAARRERDRRGDPAARGADPGACGHERLARIPLARGGPALGLRPRRSARRRPRRRDPGDRRPLPARSATPSGLRASAARARELGFDGKWALHPDQIEPLNVAFSPSPEEAGHARAILDALARRR